MGQARSVAPGGRLAFKVLVLVGVLALTGCHESRAIKMVQGAPPPAVGLEVLLGIGPADTYSEWLESAVRSRGESTDNYSWSADRDLAGLRSSEWAVSYTDRQGYGHFFVTHLGSKKVVYLNRDLIAAERVGFLQEDSHPSLTLEVESQGLQPCRRYNDKGWCWAIRGSATNVGPPIVDLSADVELALSVGGRTLAGEALSNTAPDKFRHTSTSRPWPTDQSRTFEYRSRIIPEVYAGPGNVGSGVAVFEVSIATTNRGRVSEKLVVERLTWPPKEAVREWGRGSP